MVRLLGVRVLDLSCLLPSPEHSELWVADSWIRLFTSGFVSTPRLDFLLKPVLGTIWAFQKSHAHKPINTNENKSAPNMCSLSLAGWAPVATGAGEVSWPSLPPSGCPPSSSCSGSSLITWALSMRKPLHPRWASHLWKEARKTAVFASVSGTRVFPAVLGGISSPVACGPIAQGGRSRPFPFWVKQNPLS